MARPWKRGFPFDYAREPLAEYLENSDLVAAFTMWVPRSVLVARFAKRQRNRLESLGLRLNSLHPRRWRHRSWLVSDLYNKQEEHAKMYSSWLEYCGSLCPQTHWLIDCSARQPEAHLVIAL